MVTRGQPSTDTSASRTSEYDASEQALGGLLAGYDNAGNFLWHKQISSTKSITVGNVSFTEDGQFYVSGSV